MTDSDRQKEISKILWANSQINKLSFEKKDFNPINAGHGLFVKTVGQDIVYDLRLAKEKPFWGYTHPLMVQHNFKALNNPLELHYYSVPCNEFVRIIETFQKVHFAEVLDPNFKITYHNIVIHFDEELLNYDIDDIKNTVSKLIAENKETYFWLVEEDLILLSENKVFNFYDLMRTEHVHLCLKFHFINSVFIYSHHIFSEDENIQLFLALKTLYKDVISQDIQGKNSIDYKTIDTFIEKNSSLPIKRIGRYLLLDRTIKHDSLNNNGIIVSELKGQNKTIFAFPIACTTHEVTDVLQRIKDSI